MAGYLTILKSKGQQVYLPVSLTEITLEFSGGNTPLDAWGCSRLLEENATNHCVKSQSNPSLLGRVPANKKQQR